jgi:predicted ATPase
MELAWATILQGWALAEQGQGEEGIVQMCQGLDAWRATGAGVIPYFLALLAEAYGKMKQVEKGLHVLDEVIASIPKAEKSFSGAELYRLKGTLTLQSQTGQRQVMGGSKTSQDKSADASPEYPIPSTQAEAEAEACFLRAMEIARHQQAKSLELRVVMSLARLWQQQGRKAEARQRLAEIYGWFTEGFDTVDLKEARALVEELA